MSVLVTGGNGHLGAYVLKALDDRKELPISYDIQPPPDGLNKIAGKIKFIKGDILNITDMLRVLKENAVDRIIHLAAIVTSASQQNPVQAHQLNTGGTLNVLECARIMNIKRVVYSSSLSVYGFKAEGNPIKEDDQKEPVSLYGATKLFSEHLIYAYHKTFGVDSVVVRFPVIWGPSLESRIDKFSAHASSKFSDIVEKPSRGEEAIIPGGNQKYELLYVKDAAYSLLLALYAKKLEHRIFNIGSGGMISLQELAEIVKSYKPNTSIKILDGSDYFTVPALSYEDISRAKEELGYEPKYKYREAVKDYMLSLGIPK